jgi:hypothetical protein
MTAKEIFEIIGIFALSGIKFSFVGVPAAVFSDYSFGKSLFVTISGGFTGAIIFVNFSDWIIHRLRKLVPKSTEPKKKFTYQNKLIVFLKNKFGLTGLVFLTPPLLSIPLGSFLAVRYFKNKKKILIYMFISIAGWAILLYEFYHLFKRPS